MQAVHTIVKTFSNVAIWHWLSQHVESDSHHVLQVVRREGHFVCQCKVLAQSLHAHNVESSHLLW